MSSGMVPQEFRSRVSGDGTTVSLSSQHLESVPDWLGNLTALTKLNLRGNQLTAVHKSLGNLTALKELDLGGNQLTAVPRPLVIAGSRQSRVSECTAHKRIPAATLTLEAFANGLRIPPAARRALGLAPGAPG